MFYFLITVKFYKFLKFITISASARRLAEARAKNKHFPFTFGKAKERMN
jgi:hypothetical protein